MQHRRFIQVVLKKNTDADKLIDIVKKESFAEIIED